MNARTVARIVNGDDDREVFAKMVEVTLTDGSRVYDVHLVASEIGAQTEASARLLLLQLTNAITEASNTEAEIVLS